MLKDELNTSLQAPSYGPLNLLVASIATNEVIRFLLGLDLKSLGTRLYIDSSTYNITFSPIKFNASCYCRKSRPQPCRSLPDRFDKIAKTYIESRESGSLNALLLDELLPKLIPSERPFDVLDLGCGIGTAALLLAKGGHCVTGIDSSPAMIKAFRKRVPPGLRKRICVVQGDALTVPLSKKFDFILLNLILDHIENPKALLQKCRDSLKSGGHLIVVVPHPFKDCGFWEKTQNNGKWEYHRFFVDNYFHHGLLNKSREDAQGNTVVPQVTSFYRTVSDYYGILIDCGFAVQKLMEPCPEPPSSGTSANYIKASRIPYFLVLVATCRSSLEPK